VARPGIVHRIDKDTSGVIVAAKTDAAHHGLSALFAAHDIDRVYIALTRGAPRPAKGTIEGAIARSTHDRKKMALVKSGGRHAVTHYATERAFGPQEKPLAARLACRLETGRTPPDPRPPGQQGDALPGRSGLRLRARRPPRSAPPSKLHCFRGRPLHAAVLGFRHPITGEAIRCESPLPPDMADLEAGLAEL